MEYWEPMYEANRNHPYSQKLKPLYRITNAIYMAPTEMMIDEAYFLGGETYLLDVPKIAGIDIDTEEDMELARAMINYYISQNPQYLY